MPLVIKKMIGHIMIIRYYLLKLEEDYQNIKINFETRAKK